MEARERYKSFWGAVLAVFLAFNGISETQTTNIDCGGKAFYCLNSTNFMICVDQGNGIATTVENMSLPCPPGTECQPDNIFECEFPRYTTPSANILVTNGITTNVADVDSASASVATQVFNTSENNTLNDFTTVSSAAAVDASVVKEITTNKNQSTVPSTTESTTLGTENGLITTPTVIVQESNHSTDVTDRFAVDTNYNITLSTQEVTMNTLSDSTIESSTKSSRNSETITTENAIISNETTTMSQNSDRDLYNHTTFFIASTKQLIYETSTLSGNSLNDVSSIPDTTKFVMQTAAQDNVEYSNNYITRTNTATDFNTESSVKNSETTQHTDFVTTKSKIPINEITIDPFYSTNNFNNIMNESYTSSVSLPITTNQLYETSTLSGNSLNHVSSIPDNAMYGRETTADDNIENSTDSVSRTNTTLIFHIESSVTNLETTQHTDFVTTKSNTINEITTEALHLNPTLNNRINETNTSSVSLPMPSTALYDTSTTYNNPVNDLATVQENADFLPQTITENNVVSTANLATGSNVTGLNTGIELNLRSNGTTSYTNLGTTKSGTVINEMTNESAYSTVLIPLTTGLVYEQRTINSNLQDNIESTTSSISGSNTTQVFNTELEHNVTSDKTSQYENFVTTENGILINKLANESYHTDINLDNKITETADPIIVGSKATTLVYETSTIYDNLLENVSIIQNNTMSVMHTTDENVPSNVNKNDENAPNLSMINQTINHNIPFEPNITINDSTAQYKDVVTTQPGTTTNQSTSDSNLANTDLYDRTMETADSTIQIPTTTNLFYQTRSLHDNLLHNDLANNNDTFVTSKINDLNTENSVNLENVANVIYIFNTTLKPNIPSSKNINKNQSVTTEKGTINITPVNLINISLHLKENNISNNNLLKSVLSTQSDYILVTPIETENNNESLVTTPNSNDKNVTKSIDKLSTWYFNYTDNSYTAHDNNKIIEQTITENYVNNLTNFTSPSTYFNTPLTSETTNFSEIENKVKNYDLGSTNNNTSSYFYDYDTGNTIQLDKSDTNENNIFTSKITIDNLHTGITKSVETYRAENTSITYNKTVTESPSSLTSSVLNNESLSENEYLEYKTDLNTNVITENIIRSQGTLTTNELEKDTIIDYFSNANMSVTTKNLASETNQTNNDTITETPNESNNAINIIYNHSAELQDYDNEQILAFITSHPLVTEVPMTDTLQTFTSSVNQSQKEENIVFGNTSTSLSTSIDLPQTLTTESVSSSYLGYTIETNDDWNSNASITVYNNRTVTETSQPTVKLPPEIIENLIVVQTATTTITPESRGSLSFLNLTLNETYTNYVSNEVSTQSSITTSSVGDSFRSTAESTSNTSKSILGTSKFASQDFQQVGNIRVTKNPLATTIYNLDSNTASNTTLYLMTKDIHNTSQVEKITTAPNLYNIENPTGIASFFKITTNEPTISATISESIVTELNNLVVDNPNDVSSTTEPNFTGISTQHEPNNITELKNQVKYEVQKIQNLTSESFDKVNNKTTEIEVSKNNNTKNKISKGNSIEESTTENSNILSRTTVSMKLLGNNFVEEDVVVINSKTLPQSSTNLKNDVTETSYNVNLPAMNVYPSENTIVLQEVPNNPSLVLISTLAYETPEEIDHLKPVTKYDPMTLTTNTANKSDSNNRIESSNRIVSPPHTILTTESLYFEKAVKESNIAFTTSNNINDDAVGEYTLKSYSVTDYPPELATRKSVKIKEPGGPTKINEVRETNQSIFNINNAVQQNYAKKNSISFMSTDNPVTIPIEALTHVRSISPTANNLKSVSVITSRNSNKGNSNAKSDQTQELTNDGHHHHNVPKTNAEILQFSCAKRRRGRYSDLLDCRIFYICIGKNDPIIGHCPLNTVFSDSRKQCTKTLSECVRQNDFECTSEGRFLNHIEVDVYYICVKNKNDNSYVRFKFHCENGYYLSRDLIKCIYVESRSDGNTISTDESSKSDTSNKSDASLNNSKEKTRKNKEKRKTDKVKKIKENRNASRDHTVHEFICENQGKFPDYNDCRKYYECKKTKESFRRKRRKCDRGEVFHREKLKCVDAESYECM